MKMSTYTYVCYETILWVIYILTTTYKLLLNVKWKHWKSYIFNLQPIITKHTQPPRNLTRFSRYTESHLYFRVQFRNVWLFLH